MKKKMMYTFVLLVVFAVSSFGHNLPWEGDQWGWIQNPSNDHWYTFTRRPAGFSAANQLELQQSAELMGGYLVKIDDTSENVWVSQNLLGHTAQDTHYLTIGARKESGVWRWIVDGSLVDWEPEWMENPFEDPNISACTIYPDGRWMAIGISTVCMGIVEREYPPETPTPIIVATPTYTPNPKLTINTITSLECGVLGVEYDLQQVVTSGKSMSFELKTSNVGVELDGSLISYIPPANFTGSVRIRFTVYGEDGQYKVGMLRIVVGENSETPTVVPSTPTPTSIPISTPTPIPTISLNLPPVVKVYPITVLDSPQVITVMASDPENDHLTITFDQKVELVASSKISNQYVWDVYLNTTTSIEVTDGNNRVSTIVTVLSNSATVTTILNISAEVELPKVEEFEVCDDLLGGIVDINDVDSPLTKALFFRWNSKFNTIFVRINNGIEKILYHSEDGTNVFWWRKGSIQGEFENGPETNIYSFRVGEWIKHVNYSVRGSL